MRLSSAFFTLAQLAWVAQTTKTDPAVLDACPGYRAENAQTNGATFTADLILDGDGCNVFGEDIQELKLQVTYETKTRIHLKITDAQKERYEIPESVLPRPQADPSVSPEGADIRFNYTASPFAFSIFRASTQEVLFNTASHPLIFEPQFLRVKTSLPTDPNLYGFGEHTDPFRLPTHDYTHTLWAKDRPFLPQRKNLYGVHPVYFEHRTTGTHGVFLANSNGIDVRINDTDGVNTLEYNVIGGVLDFYFFAGSESDPAAVARQYAEVVGKPAEVPYWSLGFHQCRFGYKNYVEVADVITKYAEANIPLEVMWTDIDYMQGRRVFTFDPEYFPVNRVREIVDYLHAHDQKYVLMTDPAVAYLPNQGHGPYDRGHDAGIFVNTPNASAEYLGVAWPGVVVFPDWLNEKTQDYWNREFEIFNNPETGVDIDGSWIDMNEPTNFCGFPCTDVNAAARGNPPPRNSPPPDPDAPIFGNQKREEKVHMMPSASFPEVPQSPAADIPVVVNTRYRRVDHAGEDLLNPPYQLEATALSDGTVNTNNVHSNGLVEYDTHNLYGLMMSVATHKALLNRCPGLRTFVITRSTFAGAGASVGKWLGDNRASWEQYRQSIQGILEFASIFHVPLIGADTCGFNDNTTEQLCARWATLGAFYPFMRNHNGDRENSQEFYLWPTVAQAARNALDVRYRLLDYLYTAFHKASIDGSPVLNPLFYKYPKDAKTFGIDTQFFFGDSILVSPVLDQDSTTVNPYFPDDIFYDFHTFAPIRVEGGGIVQLTDVNVTSIPTHIRGGTVLPLRIAGAMTTKALREKDFELIVAPGLDGTATGALYLDDGVSIQQSSVTDITFTFKDRTLVVAGTFGFGDGDLHITRVRLLNANTASSGAKVNGRTAGEDAVQYDAATGVLDVQVSIPLTGQFTLEIL